MKYIKGTFVKTIYANKDNGYVVGVLKIKETEKDIVFLFIMLQYSCVVSKS